MLKKSHNFSMEEGLRLANSDAGQQLLALLKQEHGTTLERAMEQFNTGAYDEVQKTLGSILSSPEAQALLHQLGGNGHG